MNIYYIDGQFVPENEAVVPVTDLSVLRGYGVFDFLRTYNGKPFHLDQHVIRLERSARIIGIELPHSKEEITRIVHQTLEKNEFDECTVRLVLTGGQSSDSITPGNKPRLMVMVSGLKPFPPEYYSEGVKVITSHKERFAPGAKTINYIPGILSLSEARDQGAGEAIYVDYKGSLLEGTTSNMFAFFGDTLVTPPESRILSGVTRRTVLEHCTAGFSVEVRDIHKDEIRLMDEAFLSATNKEVMPVRAIDSVILSQGRPGERTKKVMQQFREYTQQYKG